MRKKVSALIVIIIIILVVVILSVFLFTDVWQPSSSVDLNYIKEIHIDLNPTDIPKLKDIIKTHPDNYVRERAIFVLADIAIKNNVTEDVIDFLKEIAYNEENDDVRTAAYANIYLIRESYPLAIKGDLNIQVLGEIRKGENITIVASASSTVDVTEAIVGVKRVANLGGNETQGIMLTVVSRNPVRFPLNAGESKEITFKIFLAEEGEYMIFCELQLNFDRIDYQTIEKKIHLTIGKTEGEAQVLEE